jgi:hypothetical protein
MSPPVFFLLCLSLIFFQGGINSLMGINRFDTLALPTGIQTFNTIGKSTRGQAFG